MYGHFRFIDPDHSHDKKIELETITKRLERTLLKRSRKHPEKTPHWPSGGSLRWLVVAVPLSGGALKGASLGQWRHPSPSHGGSIVMKGPLGPFH